jgi:hypothetical protein
MQDTPKEAATGDKAARDLLEVEKLRAVNAKLLEVYKQMIVDAIPSNYAALCFQKSLNLAKAAIKQAEEV